MPNKGKAIKIYSLLCCTWLLYKIKAASEISEAAFILPLTEKIIFFFL
ncbi:unknown [Tannerella sp. CAG:118]|nr:unknown [Tannerella sp. CAG:118]